MIRFFKDICSFWIIPLIELIDAFHSYLHDFPINVHFRFPRKRKRKRKRKTEFRFRGKRNSVSVENGIPFPWKSEFRGNGRRNSDFRGIRNSDFRGIRNSVSVEYGIPFPWKSEFRGNGRRNSAETEDGISVKFPSSVTSFPSETERKFRGNTERKFPQKPYLRYCMIPFRSNPEAIRSHRKFFCRKCSVATGF